MTEYIVGSETDLDDGDRIIVEVDGKEVCVFNVNGNYYALLNWCVHQGGPCCEGTISGTYESSFDRETLETELVWTRDEQVLSCPWHGWEYDITTGNCLSDKDRKLPSYHVRVQDGEIIVRL